MLNIAEPMQSTKSSRATKVAEVSLFSAVDLSDVARVKAWLSDRIKKYAVSGMISDVITMSPAMAKYILTHHNIENRGVRKRRVVEFATAIKEGRWRLTSQGISFSREGYLNNGQHRLCGIVNAARPVDIYVTFGEDRDVFSVLDTGATRGGSDTLFIEGFKNTSTMAAAARLLISINAKTIASNNHIANDQILGFVNSHSDLETAAEEGCRVGKKIKCSTAATTAAFYIISKSSKRSDLLLNFTGRLFDGLTSDAAIMKLRDALMKNTADKESLGRGSAKAATQCGMIIRAWNMHLKKQRGTPRWSTSEPLPTAE